MDPQKRPIPWNVEFALMLDELGAWVDTELAAGQPPKWVARVSAMGARYIASRLRAEVGRPR
jgi:hypothetical protein